MSRPRLVEAGPEHLDVLVGWIPDAVACDLWSGGRIEFPIDRVGLREALALPGSREYALLEADQYVGFGQISVWPVDRGHLSRLIIAPGMRGGGRGRTLVRLLLDCLRSSGCTTASLNVDQGNARAVGLYRSIGFEEAERPGGGGEPEWVYMAMRLTVRPPPEFETI